MANSFPALQRQCSTPEVEGDIGRIVFAERWEGVREALLFWWPNQEGKVGPPPFRRDYTTPYDVRGRPGAVGAASLPPS